MIKLLVAIDVKRGLADETGIPWDLPKDREYVHNLISGQDVVMGYRTYQERKSPRQDGGESFVIVEPGTDLKDGFEPVTDVDAFLSQYRNQARDIWVMGGAKVYAQLISNVDTLFITHVKADFNCTKFFPEFETSFHRTKQAPEQTENGIGFQFEVWEPN